ncbi:hypothetical protein ACFU8I_09435 [Streptomyces sp. NPDC057540]|uniref:hypothetical protein n=1 Tax=Streptomyces sp. NPDC057540 TaxID=3346160 RepID=UPI0036A05779
MTEGRQSLETKHIQGQVITHTIVKPLRADAAPAAVEEPSSTKPAEAEADVSQD